MRAFARMACLALAFAGFCLSARAEESWKIAPDPAPLPKPDLSGLAPVNDIKMYYEIYNASGGDPVLLLHGGLGSTLNWGNQVPALTKNHEVIAVDSRGHGRSTRSDKPFDYHLMASDVLATMDYLKLDKVSIVGWSDGGIIGIDIAINNPERLRKLLAFGANYNISGFDPNLESNPLFTKVVTKLAADYRKLSPTPGDFDNFLKAVSAMWESQPDFKPGELARIKAPTLIADGQYEEAIRPEHTAELAKLVPGAQLVIIPNVSHLGLWQDPVAFNKVMTDFLDGK
jgi:pimeloyl-ACP methyl ester carboxylesterase